MESGYFDATLNYIQTAAAYTIEFTLQNDLPAYYEVGQNENGELITRTSCLMIIFPEIMPHRTDGDGNEAPGITSQDGLLFSANIERNTTYVDDSNDIDCTMDPVDSNEGNLACYRVTHDNFEDLPGGSKLRIQITGPENAISE